MDEWPATRSHARNWQEVPRGVFNPEQADGKTGVRQSHNDGVPHLTQKGSEHSA